MMREAANAVWLSIVRTIVPLVVGGALSLWAGWGIQVDPEFEGALSTLLFGGFTAAYYVAVRLLETYVAPKLGWLLGAAKAPAVYTPESPKNLEVVQGDPLDRVPNGPDHRAGD